MLVSLCIGLFLSALDSTIVSTALVPITNSLRGFDRSSWIINAYLLTYTGAAT
jgi:MFS family permease